jgi:hypothetical protein
MMPGMTPNSTPNPTEHNRVTVQQAAIILGISDEAVRARIRRGKLAGDKRGSTWVVYLPDEAGQEPTQQDTTHHPTQPTAHTQQHTTQHQGPLVAHLEGEVAYLRERLEEADRQRGSLQRQLEAERQRADVLQLRAIGSGTPDTASDTPQGARTHDTGLQGLRTLRLWWRRLWGA